MNWLPVPARATISRHAQAHTRTHTSPVLNGQSGREQCAHRATAPSARKTSEDDSPARDPLALENGTAQLPRANISPAHHTQPRAQPPNPATREQHARCARAAAARPPSLPRAVSSGRVVRRFCRGARCVAPREVPGWWAEGEATPASVPKERSAPRAENTHARAALARAPPRAARIVCAKRAGDLAAINFATHEHPRTLENVLSPGGRQAGE